MKGTIVIELKDTNENEITRFEEIFRALIDCGGLTGVKGGSTTIHFDGQGEFQGVEFKYFPWRKRKT